ncbi:MAG TPA: alpha/beta hydrolase [Propionibacteriaceae bacterium]|nr:alpha/beta hydrolase [Propionibacteriaceae bacterium]
MPEVRPPGFTEPPPGIRLGRYTEQKASWKPCKKNLQCATVLVPLDYGQPDSTAISVSMAKKVATATPKLGTLFIDPGGPGGSGIEFVEFFRSKGLERYDIIGWDPRGVGQSTPVDCQGTDLERLTSMDISPDNASEENDLLAADRELGLACLRASGPLLQHISTPDVARDLDVLRTLVGEDKLNYYGASYGTRIGATYAELYPQRVGRLVLDGAVNITNDTSVSQAVGFQRALEGFATWCAQRECKLGNTKDAVLKSVANFWQRLDQEPLKVGRRQLTQQLGVAGVISVLYAPPEAYKYLLQALESAITDRDGRYLLFLADQLNQRDQQGKFAQTNYAFPAIRCLDDADLGVQGERRLAEEANKLAPTIGPVFGADLVCAMWPVPAVPKVTLDGEGAPPIVVIGTTGDPATPYEYAVSMAKQLQSGVLVTLRGFGHTGYGQSGCVQKLVVRYLNEGKVPADGTTC